MTRDGDDTHGESETDRAWREIVAHYGERPTADIDAEPDLHEATASLRRQPDDDAVRRPSSLDDTEDGFRPPPAPPFPRPRTWQRGVAWAGVFVGPVLAILLTVLDLRAPSLLGWAVFCWTVAGFVYLAVVAPRAPRDPWDDGSRV